MKSSPSVCIVGAGFSGAVIARTLADAGIPSVIFEERNHIGGNCHTERCPETGIMLHKYGPHIFHTDNQDVWDYVNRFCNMMPYVLRIKTTYKNQVYQLPINLHTINQFFGKAMRPAEAQAFIKEKAINSLSCPKTFEEQALSMIGPELYEAFFKEYTIKQWGLSPTDLPASILKRLPLRFTYDDNYFFHRYQGIPEHGYSSLIENILDHERISVKLGTPYEPGNRNWKHLFYSGPIDRYFNFERGRLGYRTLTFKSETLDGDYQGTALMNYAEKSVPHTRINEHKHFTPWETHKKTVITTEYSSYCGKSDIPYYPIRLAEEKKLISEYESLSSGLHEKVTFIGRLGTYQYLDMDQTIAQALKCAQGYLNDL